MRQPTEFGRFFCKRYSVLAGADDLATAFVPLRPRRIAEQPFQGAICRTDAAPIQVSLVTATRHTVLRLASHIATSTEDLCFVNLQLEGVGRTAQRGQEQISAIGDLALADTTEPFEIANRHDFKLFCFAIPRRLLPKGLLDRPRLNLSTTRRLGGYAELCLSGCQLAKASAPIGAHVIDLISHGPANGLILEFSLDLQSRSFARLLRYC
jgi:AraC family transcriptional regulator, positive regulator of tynA and feaB